MMSIEYDLVREVVAADLTIEAGMEKLIRFCNSAKPWIGNSRLLSTDYAGGTSALSSWLERLNVANQWPIRDWETRSLLFGICRTMDDKGDEVCDLEVSGRPWGTWSEGDDDHERATNPVDGHANWDALRELYQMILSSEDDEIIDVYDYTLCLGYSALGLKQAVSQMSLGYLVGKHIFVCWPGGDFVAIPPTV